MSRAALALVTAALVPVGLGLVGTTACPRPLADQAGPARVPTDAIAVLRVPELARVSEVLPFLAPAGEAGLLGDAGRTLRLLLGELAPRGEVLVSLRPTGEVLLFLPVAEEAAFRLAMELLLPGITPGERVGGTRTWHRKAGEVALLERPLPSGTLLWLAPADALAAAALLDAMAAGGSGHEGEAGKDEVAHLDATGAALARLSPALVSVLGGEDAVTDVRGALSTTAGELRLLLSAGLKSAAREGLEGSFAEAGARPRELCGLLEGAVAAVRLPVAWLRGGEEVAGPLGNLEGQLTVAIYPSSSGQPSWALLGDPAGLVGKEELAAAVRGVEGVEGVEGAERPEEEQLTLGGRRASRLRSAGGPPLLTVVEEDLFLLAVGAEPQVRAALTGVGRCDDEGAAAPAWLRLRPEALRTALGSGDGEVGPASDAVGALRRLADRFRLGAEVVEGQARLEQGRVLLELRAR